MKDIKVTEIIAIFLVVAGTLLIFLNMFVPPIGIIADSALYALGQFFALGGGLLGVNTFNSIKIKELEEKYKKRDEDNIQ